jgi:hypothetical protein
MSAEGQATRLGGTAPNGSASTAYECPLSNNADMPRAMRTCALGRSLLQIARAQIFSGGPGTILMSGELTTLSNYGPPV